jgi:serine/threonine protein kinase
MTEALKKVGNYRLVRKIGSGATSEVFEGRKEGEIERYAIKMIKVKNMSKEQREMIAKEVVIIKSIEHPHIVRLHETLETTNNYYLVFEFCERGDLEKYLKENIDNLLPPDNVRKIIGCIAEAVRHLHARGIAHRDIKLANVLLKKDFTIKLADFGFAR